MELYSSNDSYKLYKGDMRNMLDVIKKESIDAVLTDPPYELNFMGKGWDNSGIAFQSDTWKKCFEVLKPGGYLLAFGGSRTFHRIACAIEDAGFEIRDTIMWLYGCLSNDTEILTNNGWKNSETITTGDEIYSLDLQKDIIIKNKCLNVFKYDYDGEMVNLKNDNTNQLLTPNHHCIIKDIIRTRIKHNTNYKSYDYWYYKDAWQIRSGTVKLPLASNYDGTLEIGNLFAELLGWVISEGTYLKDTNAIMITQSSVNQKYVERIRYILGKLHIKYNEYSRERTYKNKTYTEYDFYIGKEAEKTVDKIKELAPNKKLNWNLLELSLSNKEFLIKGLLQGDGAKCNNTLGFSAFYQKDIQQLQIFQVLLHLTGKQGWINEKKYSCSIHNNPITELQGKHFKNRFIKYDGKYVWCIETEIGNFIAKRDGKIFITGNSGFPKSMDISKSIDKRSGVQGEKIGERTFGKTSTGQNSGWHNNNIAQLGKQDIFAPATELAKKWQGWGSQLKPSFEPIIVARKPFKGSLVDNVIEYGVGGLNIDECRVGNEERQNPQAGFIRRGRTDEEVFMGTDKNRPEGTLTVNGRFPANTILTYDETDFDEVCGGFPKSKGSISQNVYTKTPKYYGNALLESNTKRFSYQEGYNDNGSASRYFYCAKASKKDRDEGLDEFETKSHEEINNRKEGSAGATRQYGGGTNPFLSVSCPRKNTHPTVKPTELMQYLVRLVSPDGATILDPFNGSGSTGKAVMYENRERNKNYKYIGIELTEEYLPISKARIEYVCNLEPEKDMQMTIFDFIEEE